MIIFALRPFRAYVYYHKDIFFLVNHKIFLLFHRFLTLFISAKFLVSPLPLPYHSLTTPLPLPYHSLATPLLRPFHSPFTPHSLPIHSPFTPHSLPSHSFLPSPQKLRLLSACCPLDVRLLSAFKADNKRTSSGQQADNRRSWYLEVIVLSPCFSRLKRHLVQCRFNGVKLLSLTKAIKNTI